MLANYAFCTKGATSWGPCGQVYEKEFTCKSYQSFVIALLRMLGQAIVQSQDLPMTLVLLVASQDSSQL